MKLRKAFVFFLNAIIKLIEGRLVNNNKISIFCNENDDNILALSNSLEGGQGIYVYVKNQDNIPDWFNEYDNIIVVSYNGLNLLWSIFSSKYILYTHGFINGIQLSKRQSLVNLWHGMPIKQFGEMSISTSYGDRPKPSFDYTLATHQFYCSGLTQAFNSNSEKCLILGNPRNEVLINNYLQKNVDHFFNSLQIKSKSTILWLPTYRKSSKGELRLDGKPIHFSLDFWEELNQALIYSDSSLLIKAHPMDECVIPVRGLSNIDFITDQELVLNSITLYSLLTSVDILVSDASSVLIDFLLISSKVVIFFPDYNEYKTSRGFYDSRLYDDYDVIFTNTDFIEKIRLLNSLHFPIVDVSKYHTHNSGFVSRVESYLFTNQSENH